MHTIYYVILEYIAEQFYDYIADFKKKKNFIHPNILKL